MNKKYRMWNKAIAIVSAVTLAITCVAVPINADAAKKIKLNKTKCTLVAGKSIALKLVNNKKKVSWSSSNKKVIKVSKKGVVKGIKKGSGKIIAKAGGKKYVCAVKVKAKSSVTPTGTPSITAVPSTSAVPGTATTATPTTTATAPESMSACGTDTLTVGSMKVTLAMTSAEVKKSIGAEPDRIDLSPQGYITYIYNPSGNYSNYLMVQFLNDAVVGMNSISNYFIYENVLSSRMKATTLESNGWSTSGLSWYTALDANNGKSGIAAYSITTDHARVIAYTDYWGDKDTYGIQIFAKNITINSMIYPKDCTYTDAVLKDMGNESFEMMNAYRVYKGVGSVTRNTIIDTLAKNHSVDMATNNFFDHTGSSGKSYYDRLMDVVTQLDFKSYGENISCGCSDSIGFVNFWIESQNHRGILIDGKYTYAGCGMGYSATSSYKTYGTMDFINLF